MTVQRRGARLNSSTLTDRLTENSQSTPAHAAAAARFAVGRYNNVSISIYTRYGATAGSDNTSRTKHAQIAADDTEINRR